MRHRQLFLAVLIAWFPQFSVISNSEAVPTSDLLPSNQNGAFAFASGSGSLLGASTLNTVVVAVPGAPIVVLSLSSGIPDLSSYTTGTATGSTFFSPPVQSIGVFLNGSAFTGLPGAQLLNASAKIAEPASLLLLGVGLLVLGLIVRWRRMSVNKKLAVGAQPNETETNAGVQITP